jgi:hypothetical protein
MNFGEILRHLGRSDAEIHSVFRCGSRVYGSAGPTSDEDFVVILAQKGAKQDLAFRGGANFVLHGVETFRDAIAAQSVFALECLFLPPEHRLKETRGAFSYKPDRKKLADSAAARSDADFAKARKTFDDEPGPAKKKLFHAIRVPMFARQIATHGRLVDYAEASPIWFELRADEALAWEALEKRFGPLRDAVCGDLATLGKRR